MLKSFLIYMKKILAFPMAFVLILSFSACDKGCYNPSLEKASQNTICTTDCPGVVGCDGKSYCNECEANKLGVAVDN
jgi:hypothetical protein